MMNGNLLWQIAITFASLSFIAIGGVSAVMPGMHRQVVEVLGWMNDATFANLFAIAQAAPGPNVMVIALIGWYVAGPVGLGVAILSWVVPTSGISLAAGRLVHGLADASWVAVAKEGLVPVAIGLSLAGGVVMARAADRGSLAVLITAGAATFVVASDRNPVWALALGALASMVAMGLGAPIR
jgi:chromate transporter